MLSIPGALIYDIFTLAEHCHKCPWSFECSGDSNPAPLGRGHWRPTLQTGVCCHERAWEWQWLFLPGWSHPSPLALPPNTTPRSGIPPFPPRVLWQVESTSISGLFQLHRRVGCRGRRCWMGFLKCFLDISTGNDERLGPGAEGRMAPWLASKCWTLRKAREKRTEAQTRDIPILFCSTPALLFPLSHFAYLNPFYYFLSFIRNEFCTAKTSEPPMGKSLFQADSIWLEGQVFIATGPPG